MSPTRETDIDTRLVPLFRVGQENFKLQTCLISCPLGDGEKKFRFRPPEFLPQAGVEKTRNGRHAAMKFRKLKFSFGQRVAVHEGHVAVYGKNY